MTTAQFQGGFMDDGTNEPRIFRLNVEGLVLEYAESGSDSSLPLESRLTKLREQFPGRRFFVIDELVRP